MEKLIWTAPTYFHTTGTISETKRSHFRAFSNVGVFLQFGAVTATAVMETLHLRKVFKIRIRAAVRLTTFFYLGELGYTENSEHYSTRTVLPTFWPTIELLWREKKQLAYLEVQVSRFKPIEDIWAMIALKFFKYGRNYMSR